MPPRSHPHLADLGRCVRDGRRSGPVAPRPGGPANRLRPAGPTELATESGDLPQRRQGDRGRRGQLPVAADAYSDRTYRVQVPVPDPSDGEASGPACPAQVRGPQRAGGDDHPQRVVGHGGAGDRPGGSSTSRWLPTASSRSPSRRLRQCGAARRRHGSRRGDAAGAGHAAAPPVQRSGPGERRADRAGHARNVPTGANLGLVRRVSGWAWQFSGRRQGRRRQVLAARHPCDDEHGRYEYRVILGGAGTVLAQSQVRKQRVLPAEVTLTGPGRSRAGRR